MQQDNVIIYGRLKKKGILCPSLVCFILRYSSNWTPQRLHSEPFQPKEKHNVGPFDAMTTTTTLVSVLHRFECLAETSNVLDHQKVNNKI
jgi:hypothetical protein